MKLLSILFLALSTNLLIAQSSPSNKPIMKFDTLIYDYGEIPYKGDGNCTFKITNVGSTPLVINEVTTSCGCAAVDWPRKPIMKNESADIIIKYDTRRPGNFNKSIVIKSNAENTPITLEIKGTVLAKK
jgi:hypothetical protein